MSTLLDGKISQRKLLSCQIGCETHPCEQARKSFPILKPFKWDVVINSIVTILYIILVNNWSLWEELFEFCGCVWHNSKLFDGVFQAGAQDNHRLAECLRDAHQFLTITQVPATSQLHGVHYQAGIKTYSLFDGACLSFCKILVVDESCA